MRLQAYFFSVIAMIGLLSCTGQEAGRLEYRLADYGIEPGSTENMAPRLAKVLNEIKAEAGGRDVVVHFNPGRYDFYPDEAPSRTYYISNHDQPNPKQVGMALEDWKGLTLEGGGAELVFHGRMLPISMLRSTGCTLRNFSIDFAQPHITQATVVENDTIQGELTLEIASWVQYEVKQDTFYVSGEGWKKVPSSAIAFEPDTRRLVYQTSDVPVRFSQVKDLGNRHIQAKGWKNARLVPGTVLALRTWDRPAPGIFLSHNKNTQLQNVQIHYAEGMGVLAQLCENITLDSVSVCLKGKDDPRYFTTQADATHFSGCKGKIISTNGVYENMMDDAINVHGTYLKVLERSQTMEMMDATYIIKEIHPEGQEQVEGAKKFRLTFTEALPESVDPTQSIGIVEDNLFDHTSGTAILLCGDCNGWYETGACHEVLIRKNHFINALTNMFQFTNAVISIYPEIPDLAHQKKYFHSGIVIEDNLFETFDQPILYAKSVDGLIFRRNEIKTNHDYPPFHWNQKRFLLERVANADIEE